MYPPDINTPSTWKRYRPGLCEGCQAMCCNMPTEVYKADMVRLGLIGEDETKDGIRIVAKRLEKSGILQSYRVSTGIGILERNSSGDCIYMDKNRRCTVYENRPDACRNFPKVSSRPGYCPASLKK